VIDATNWRAEHHDDPLNSDVAALYWWPEAGREETAESMTAPIDLTY
jgi:hypothetical protein